METRIEDLKLSRNNGHLAKLGTTDANRSSLHLTDGLYVLAAVWIASRVPLSGTLPYLPIAFNERSIKLAFAATAIFLVFKQFTRVFLS